MYSHKPSGLTPDAIRKIFKKFIKRQIRLFRIRDALTHDAESDAVAQLR